MSQRRGEVTSTSYTGGGDLYAMQAALASWIAAAGECIYMRVGDLPHRLYNGIRGRFPLDKVVNIWRDGDDILAFAFCYPHWPAFDAQVHPDHRGGELERDVLVWVQRNTRAWMPENADVDSRIVTDVLAADEPRRRLLVELGYQFKRHFLNLTERSLAQEIPEPSLPHGFYIRPAAGLHEAAQLAAVHSGSFGSNWTTELYRDEVMAKPGYEVEREMVVVAPDGRFAAFCIYWLDPVNRLGYFEPVGTHRDFQRRGLARALMLETMRRMRAQGMAQAQVEHDVANPASSNLYASLGFRAICEIHEYALRAIP